MTAESQKETLEFQTEVQQLLHLMVHALYSNKEIFLRELISNASDACDKLRFEALGDDALYGDDGDLKVHISVDKDAKTVTVADNGIGMSRQEVIDNIGTIASSGTRKFLENLSGNQKKDSQLIGQFGVGFYSAFIVADKVTVITRRAGTGTDQGVRWESDGGGRFTLENVEREQRGTEVVLHLKEDEAEFLDDWRIRNIIKKYSDHIPMPILLKGEPPPEPDDKEEGEDDQDKPTEGDWWETVNKASALWARPKSEIKDEEYHEFYKHISHDFEEPMEVLHNRVEGTTSYISLLYLPKKPPFDLWDRDHMHGVKLYVKRVFIMDDAEKLVPRYLRFIRGVVDSDDLPLNISREILQSNKTIDAIRTGVTKRVLSHLAKMAEKDSEKYAEVWKNFGVVLKEGPVEDYANREAILKLLRFDSTHEGTHNAGGKQTVSLADYIGRMKEGQNKIWYITADSLAAAKSSPHLEVFKKQGIEVLLMHDRVDEWAMGQLYEFDGKSFASAAKGELDLPEDEAAKKEAEKAAEDNKDLTERLKKALEDKVETVRVSQRLTDSPSCLVLSEQDMALHMQRLMKEAGHELPGSKPALEVNVDHALVQRLNDESDDARFGDWAQVLLDQATLSEGGQLEDPADYVRRINDLLQATLKAA